MILVRAKDAYSDCSNGFEGSDEQSIVTGLILLHTVDNRAPSECKNLTQRYNRSAIKTASLDKFFTSNFDRK